MKYFIFLLLILSLNLNAQNTDYKIINANVFITYIDTTNTCNTLVLNSTDWKFIKYLDKKELNIPYKIKLSSMSNGSIKLFRLSYLIYKSINSNQFLIIDDIDKELHSDLTSYLIKELHNTQNNSQFLLTSHDVTQMNNFDKDQGAGLKSPLNRLRIDFLLRVV